MLLIATLRFADKASAPHHMEGHKAWLADGLSRGVLLAAGSILPAEGETGGGAVLSHALSRAEFEALLAEDPFVAHGVVTAEVTALDLSRTDPRLAFLAEAAA